MFDPFLPATELAELIRRRETTSVEVVSGYLDRIDRLNPELTAIVWLDPEATLAAARAADAALAAGREVGALPRRPHPDQGPHRPVQGQPCYYGSLGTSEEPAGEERAGGRPAAAAGFVLMGRSAAPEAGTMSVTESRRFGITRNPWDTTRSPG
ncbi:hypothetical protein A7K94_0213630, partial [Modestobacter sp. VKM Ac-2676]